MTTPCTDPHQHEVSDTDTRRAGPIERIVIFCLLGISVSLRVLCILTKEFDSDEAQHLHVVWGWANGLVQYRDLFDNHAPLFHMICAPLYAVFGDRPDVLILMRMAMIPTYVATLACTFMVAKEVLSRREAYWATVLTALLPNFFLCSLEYRADDLWMTLWMAAFLILIKGRATFRNCFAAGLILGAMVGVSLKSCVLLAALLAACLMILFWKRQNAAIGRAAFRHYAVCAIMLIAGIFLIPVLIVVYFHARGAAGSLWYGTVQHNILPGVGAWSISVWSIPGFVFTMTGLYCFVLRVSPRVFAPQKATRHVLIFLSTGSYLVLLLCFWPLLTPQDFLPVSPLAMILFTPILATERLKYGVHRMQGFFKISLPAKWPACSIPLFFAIVEVICILLLSPPWENATKNQLDLLKDALRLTEPGDSVMDLKGEMIFRKRCYYYVLESVTLERIKAGLIKDDIPESIVASHTRVAVADNSSLPPRARSFLKDNFLSVGRLRVAGKVLARRDLEQAGRPIRFNVAIPARYAVTSRGGNVAGWLDGTRYTSPRFLSTGRHEFRPAVRKNTLVLIWARAKERGFSPTIPRYRQHVKDPDSK